VFLNEPITHIKDIKGLKFHSISLFKPMLDYYGGVSVQLPVGEEIYTAMDRGLVDGYLTILGSGFFFNSLDKVTNYWVTPGWGHSSTGTFINYDALKSLPAEWQKILDDTAVDKEKEWASKWLDIWAGHMEKCTPAQH